MCEIKKSTETKIDRLTASIDRLCDLLEAKAPAAGTVMSNEILIAGRDELHGYDMTTGRVPTIGRC